MRYNSSLRCHLGKFFAKINGETYALSRAVDHQGEVHAHQLTARRGGP
jgi:transposase-like protein